MPKRTILIVAILSVTVVALVFLGLGQPLLGSIGSAGGSGPIYVKVLSVDSGVEAIKTKIAEIDGVENWALYYVRPGLTGYLIKISVKNKGEETYIINLALITSEGRQINQGDYWHMGIDSEIISTGIASEEQIQMLEKAREYPKDMMQAMLLYPALQLQPGTSTEQVLFYGLQPGEEPTKLHVIAKTSSGSVIEFDVPIRS